MKRNKIERLKATRSPYDFRTHLSQLDFSNLSEVDRFYLKNYGIYNIKLRPEHFMIRVRIAAGRIAPAKLLQLAAVAEAYGCELLLTARAQIELHGLTADNVLAAWEKTEEAGFTTLQTLTDNFRNIVTDPYDGVHESSYLEVYPLIAEMQALFLDKEAWMGMLPRKFNTAISATVQSSFHFYNNDLFFASAQKEGEWGFNVYLGGKNSEVAKDADIFVLPQQVAAMFEAIARAYCQYGLRGSRAKTRLFHLLEAIGMDDFRQKIGAFYPERLESAGTLSVEKVTKRTFEKLKNGRFGYCYRSSFGRIGVAELAQIAQYAMGNALEIRLGVDQNIYLLGLKTPEADFHEVPGASHITACAGSHYCALSLWSVKEETSFLPLKRLEKEQITTGFSGCLKGCGRHHHEDIGLVGLRTNLFGPVAKAARLFLGTEYSQNQKPARLIFHVVPLEKLSGLIDVIIDEYLASGAKDFEAFSREHLNRYSTGFLMLWFLAKLYLHEEITFAGRDEETLYGMLLRQPGFPQLHEEREYEAAVRFMMHRLWDISS